MISGFAVVRIWRQTSGCVDPRPRSIYASASSDATIKMDTAAIVQWQNAALWQRMSWVRTPLAAPIPSQQSHQSSASVAISGCAASLILPRVTKASRPQRHLAPAPPPRNLFAGTSGWAYPTWKPGFYPARRPRPRFLDFYASQLTSVEVNYTFRTLPTATMLEGWLAATPPSFRFSFKAPQRITHFKRLRECHADVSRSSSTRSPPSAQPASSARSSSSSHPTSPPTPPASHDFLAAPRLPRNRTRQLAFEFRHASWFSEETYDILRDHNAALCIAESDDLTTPEVHTAAPHTCYRLRRNGGYTPAEIAAFAKRFTLLATDRDVYIYFKHEDEPTGALNATAFLAPQASSHPEQASNDVRPSAANSQSHLSRQLPTSSRAASCSNGHLQTIVGNFLPRPNHLPAPDGPARRSLPAPPTTKSPARSSATATGSRAESAPPAPPPSSSTASKAPRNSQYVIGNANKLWRAGATSSA